MESTSDCFAPLAAARSLPDSGHSERHEPRSMGDPRADIKGNADGTTLPTSRVGSAMREPYHLYRKSEAEAVVAPPETSLD